jgi:hypothetical protein
MKRILGYVLSAIGPVLGVFLSRYTGPELAGTIGIAVSGTGGRILHLEDSPSKAP